MMMKKLLQLIRFLFVKQDVMEVYYIQGNDVLPKPLDKEEELAILDRFEDRQPLFELSCVCTKEELLNAREAYKKVYVHPDLKSYLVEVVQATRTAGDVIAGVSPRGTLALFNGAKAYAYVKGRDYVVPEDIKTVAVPILAHRMIMTSGYGQEESGSQAIQRILNQVPVPTEEWKRKT